MIPKITISLSFTLLCTHIYAGEQTSVGLENMARILRGDVRVIAIGDSYSVPYWPRIASAGLRVWPIPHITGICNGADNGPTIAECIAKCNPVSNIMASDSQGYKIERQSKEHDYFGLPVLGIREIFTDSNFSPAPDGELFELKLNIDELNLSVHGPFSQPDEHVTFQLLYRAPTNPSNQPDTLALRSWNSPDLIFSPTTQAKKFWHRGEVPDGIGRDSIARHINATAAKFSLTYESTNQYKVHIFENSPLIGTNQYFDLAGCIYHKNNPDGTPARGLYFSSLGDGSWSYSGYGVDTESTGTHNKIFSLDQFVHWLDVTTIRLNQPVVFMWLFDVEILSMEQMTLQIEELITQCNIGTSLVGISETYHLLITPHMLNVGGQGESAREYMNDHEIVCAEIATEQENVSFASIYSATDEMYFQGSSESVAWLYEKGFNAFEFGSGQINLTTYNSGDLLDGYNIHPSSNYSAMFFAAILGDIIRDAGCPADIVPDGYINIHDLLAVINGWGQVGDSDINDDGFTNVVDLIMLIGDWGDCWPVQAPFNTPAYR